MGVGVNILGSGIQASNQVTNGSSSSWENSSSSSWGNSIGGTFGSGQAVTEFNERMQNEAMAYNSAEAQIS